MQLSTTSYMKTEKEYLKPEQFGLSNDDCRHKKVIDLLDENGIKSIQELKDDPNLAKLNWFSLFRLETSIREFSSRNDLSLRSTGVTLPFVSRKNMGSVVAMLPGKF